MPKSAPVSRKPSQLIWVYGAFIIGSFLAALSIQSFLYPNRLIDGGIIGIAMILRRLTSDVYFPLYFIVLNLPFIWLSYKYIRRSFFIQMVVAVGLFSLFLVLLEDVPGYKGDVLEVLVLAGAILGFGVGLIIRYGGCLDGSEILGIIIHRRWGFTVGQVVLSFNFFVFLAYGLIFQNWTIAIRSLLMFVVAFKVMDMVIIGLEEIKLVMIISDKSAALTKGIVDNLGLGVTLIHGQGGYSGAQKEVLQVVVERLDLADLKELIVETDPSAFIATQNLNEVSFGKTSKAKAIQKIRSKRRSRKR